MKTEDLAGADRQFDSIAFLYDELMSSVPYHAWVDYLRQLLRRHECRPRAVLDLCCGTGTVSRMLARRGHEVTGVDISPEMISIARERMREEGLSIDFHVQDAARLSLGWSFDLAVSLFDSLNYILESEALQETFRRVAGHLSPGGLFVFDMNTEYALAAGLFTQRSSDPGAAVRYDWRSEYDPSARLCSIRMKFFHSPDERSVELVHYQRAYRLSEVTSMLEAAGLEPLAVYRAYTFRKASDRSDRAFFVARRP